MTSFVFYPFARITSYSQFSIIELTEVHKNMSLKKETRIKKAKLFMENREQSLKDNGLLWSLNQEHGDRNKILSLEYQVLYTN